jgi:hypothetical protein
MKYMRFSRRWILILRLHGLRCRDVIYEEGKYVDSRVKLYFLQLESGGHYVPSKHFYPTVRLNHLGVTQLTTIWLNSDRLWRTSKPSVKLMFWYEKVCESVNLRITTTPQITKIWPCNNLNRTGSSWFAITWAITTPQISKIWPCNNLNRTGSSWFAISWAITTPQVSKIWPCNNLNRTDSSWFAISWAITTPQISKIWPCSNLNKTGSSWFAVTWAITTPQISKIWSCNNLNRTGSSWFAISWAITTPQISKIFAM